MSSRQLEAGRTDCRGQETLKKGEGPFPELAQELQADWLDWGMLGRLGLCG